MDHLGIKQFMVMGFCIGGPFIWNMLQRAPERVVAAVLAQPSGFRPEMPDLFYNNNMKGWGPPLCARRPEITMEMVDAFLKQMYLANPDFVFTVTSRFRARLQDADTGAAGRCPGASVRGGDGISAMLAPNSQVSLYPWKDTPERVPLAVRHVRTFLKANRPATGFS